MPAAPLMSVAEVAARLGTTDTHIRRLTFERRIPFVKVGGKVRFQPADIDAWIDANRTEGVA